MSWFVTLVAVTGLLPQTVCLSAEAPAASAEHVQGLTPAQQVCREARLSPEPPDFRELCRRALAFLGQYASFGLVNRYSPDTDVRMEKLLFESDDLKQIHDECQRFWPNDQR